VKLGSGRGSIISLVNQTNLSRRAKKSLGWKGKLDYEKETELN